MWPSDANRQHLSMTGAEHAVLTESQPDTSLYCCSGPGQSRALSPQGYSKCQQQARLSITLI